LNFEVFCDSLQRYGRSAIVASVDGLPVSMVKVISGLTGPDPHLMGGGVLISIPPFGRKEDLIKAVVNQKYLQ
jgi:hypothetical protein